MQQALDTNQKTTYRYHRYIQYFLSSGHHYFDQSPRKLNPPGQNSFFKNSFSRLLIILFLLLGIPVIAGAASVELAWDANNPAPDGYKVFVRNEGGSYNYSNPDWQGTATQCTINQLSDGKAYYAVVRAFVNSTQSGDSNEVAFTLSASNQAPVADAGSDKAVNSGNSVELDGSASRDSDGSIATYQWTQTGGQTVTLKSQDTAKASFTAPEVTSSTKLTFQLKVTDSQGASAVDTCQVTIVPVTALDSDNDGLSDSDETNIYYTDPNNADTDGDGVNDGDEVTAGTDPTTPDRDTDTSSVKVWLEAEDGDIDIPMQIDADSAASAETYLWAPNGSGSRWSPSNSTGMAEYTFTVDSSGTYRVWGRVLASTNSDNSFFVSIDDNAYKTWDTIQSKSWTWDLVSSRNEQDPVLFKLSAGVHTLRILRREDGTKIDRILITNDAEFEPQGIGEGQDPPQDDNIVVEAETGSFTSPIVKATDTTASSGAYLWVPQGMGNAWSSATKTGLADYRFTIATSGTYWVWGRVLAPSSNDDSFFTSMDGSANKVWDIKKCESWAWELVSARGDGPLSFWLSAGTHTFTLTRREDGTKIDKLIITMDPDFTP